MKRIIPAVASTNAVIAAVCATEVFKIATSAYIPLNNYLVFNDVDGLYRYTFEAERVVWGNEITALCQLGKAFGRHWLF